MSPRIFFFFFFFYYFSLPVNRDQNKKMHPEIGFFPNTVKLFKIDGLKLRLSMSIIPFVYYTIVIIQEKCSTY